MENQSRISHGDEAEGFALEGRTVYKQGESVVEERVDERYARTSLNLYFDPCFTAA